MRMILTVEIACIRMESRMRNNLLRGCVLRTSNTMHMSSVKLAVRACTNLSVSTSAVQSEVTSALICVDINLREETPLLDDDPITTLCTAKQREHP